jgi:hypothetical protein
VVPKLNPLDANVSTALAAIAVTLSLVFASAAQPATNQSTATLSPDCSLYALVVATEVLMKDFNSTNLKIDVTKWPALMAQAQAARAAFKDPRLAPVLPKYTVLVRHLAVVGADLKRHQRSAAFVELTAAKPDLTAVVRAAERGHVVCRSGGAVFRIE